MSLAMPTATRAGAGQTIDAYPGGDDYLLDKLCRDFEAAEESSADAREEAERCRDFVNGKQWTAEEVAILRRRRQPVVWNNIIARKIALLNGLERRGRSDPKAFPRTPVEDGRADAATQALRYIADQNRFDVVRSSVYDNMLVEGFGGCEVIVEPEQMDKSALQGSTALSGGEQNYEVVINHIPWDRLFFDPHSQHPGFSDAQHLGVVIWMDRDDALDQYPGCDDILDSTFDGARSNTFDDKPRATWCDNQRRRVRVVQMWWKRQRDWWTATFTKGGFLEAPMISPYLDRHGNATCPLIMRSAMIDRDNNRYGVVRDMVPLQESINKRESKLLHSLSVNQIILEEGAVTDVDKARAEAAKPDGVIVRNKGFEFEIHKDQAEITGQFELLQYSVAQMNATGPNANMAGKDPRDQSGRAIIAQQAGGQVENEPMSDALRQWTHKAYEAAWMRVRQFWTAPKWIRVTDSDKNVQFVGLNRPVTIASLMADLDQTTPLPLQLQGLPPEDARAIQFGMTLQPGDPKLQMPIRIANDIGDMDCDITVEESTDVPTLQAEQFQTIMQLPPQILMNFPPEFFIKASSLRNKDELIKLLDDHQKAQAAGQQAQQQAQQAMQQAQVAKVQAEAKNQTASAVEKLHGMSMDHAGAGGDPGAAPPAPPPPPDPAQQAVAYAQAAKLHADARDKGLQSLERVHGMAAEHADMFHQPIIKGVGAVQPADNPLLQPEPAPAPAA